ncbi:MAG: hypothetical protein IJ852_06545 [Alphaproteobacteria bacterium]|nr:hypothetical protein [Alphaproteobacteria bacterium]
MEKKNFWAVACKACLALVVIVCGGLLASCEDYGHGEDLDERISQKTTVDGYDLKVDTLAGEVVGTVTKNGTEVDRIAVPVSQLWEKDNYESSAIDGVTPDGEVSGGVGSYTIQDGNVLKVNAKSDSKTIDGKIANLQVKEVKDPVVYNDEMNPADGESRRVATTGKLTYVYEISYNGATDTKAFDLASVMQRYTKDNTPVDPTIQSYRWDKGSRVINTNGTENLSVDLIGVYDNGSTVLVQTYRKTLRWNVATISLGTHNVNSFAVQQGAGSITKGVERTVSSDDSWTVKERADVYASTISLNSGVARPSYTFTHQGATVTAHGVSYTFPILDGNFAEVGTEATRTGVSGDNILANLVNNVALSYDKINTGYNENGVLQMKNNVTVTVGNYTFTTTNTANTATVTFVETDSEGNVKNVSSRCVAPRSVEVLTNWSTVEENNNQSTNGVRVETTTSENKTMTDQNGVVWTYVQTTTIYVTTTTLNGSTQRNAVKVVESNDFVATYKGVKKEFGHFNPSMTADRGQVSFAREASEGTVYNFVNIFTYSFNNNVQTLRPQGSIIVEKAEENIVPTFPGVGLLQNANFTANLLEGYQTWGIGGAFNCTNGTVCVWTDKNVSKLNVFQSGLVSSVYNSTCWSLKENAYVPVQAKDASAMMTWCNAQGQTVNALAYTTAQTFHFNNNHNTVVNNRLKKTIENKTTRSGKRYQIVQIIDTQNSNKVLATWTFCE